MSFFRYFKSVIIGHQLAARFLY